jgi:dinuclear metal center YbgI/SA1388 family protein
VAKQVRNTKPTKSRGPKPPVSHTLADITAAMESIAPLHRAEHWDNVGLLSGENTASVARVLLAIDLTPDVYAEAIKTRTDMLIVYHPPIFKPLKNLRVESLEPPALAIRLAQKQISIYSPHTALDAAPGGTNDVLAEKIGATVTGSFHASAAPERFLKLVTFVPEDALEKVAEAVFDAGAGHIGEKSKYTRCSFRSEGTGTFYGDASTNPAVGRPGQLERVREIRLETILPAALAAKIIRALRSAHPYEEPAFDLLQMETPPEQVGLGRFATVPAKTSLHALAKLAKRKLGLPHVQVLGPDRPVRNLAIMAGSAGRLPLDHAFRQQRFDCLITGELKHHDALAYRAANIAAICLGHAESERPVLPALQRALQHMCPGIIVQISRNESGVVSVL